MPSGRTHDAVTFLLAAPVAAGVYAYYRSVSMSAVVAAAFIFGGLMFGPDLDTISRQYSRWSVLRFIWFPYRSFFRHRSRFSHGLIFGALIRVVYFLGVVSVVIFAATYIYATYRGGRLPGIVDLTNTWGVMGQFTQANFGEHFLMLVFSGLWLGAASHTLTDMAGSFVKTGRVTEFL